MFEKLQKGKQHVKAAEPRGKTPINLENQLPIKATPYQHQIQAFQFVCKLFGLPEGGDVNPSISSRGTALLMEM